MGSVKDNTWPKKEKKKKLNLSVEGLQKSPAVVILELKPQILSVLSFLFFSSNINQMWKKCWRRDGKKGICTKSKRSLKFQEWVVEAGEKR